MVKLTVKFRPSSILGKRGRVYYQISHLGEVRQVSSRILLHPRQWEEVRMQAGGEPGRESRLCIRNKIARDMRLLHQIADVLKEKGKGFSARDIARKFAGMKGQVPFRSFMEEQIAGMLERGQRGTARCYRRSLDSFSRFLDNPDILPELIDGRLVAGYSDWLVRRGLARNTVSFYMRNLRSVYNKAVLEGLTSQRFPFRQVYTGIDKTRKRALDERTMARIFSLRLDGAKALARDMFVFSYCTRGMSFVDIAFLRKDDIRGNTISYMRHKTRQRLNIRIEPCVEQIIRRHGAGEESPYVFPIINSPDSAVAYRQYQNALSYFNRQLKRIGEMLGLAVPLTTYAARHTWATSARNRNIPLPVISAGMGHTSEKTTRIYLASLEDSEIDRANSGIVASLSGEAGQH